MKKEPSRYGTALFWCLVEERFGRSNPGDTLAAPDAFANVFGKSYRAVQQPAAEEQASDAGRAGDEIQRPVQNFGDKTGAGQDDSAISGQDEEGRKHVQTNRDDDSKFDIRFLHVLFPFRDERPCVYNTFSLGAVFLRFFFVLV